LETFAGVWGGLDLMFSFFPFLFERLVLPLLWIGGRMTDGHMYTYVYTYIKAWVGCWH
jgi:hypothetical protein